MSEELAQEIAALREGIHRLQEAANAAPVEKALPLLAELRRQIAALTIAVRTQHRLDAEDTTPNDLLRSVLEDLDADPCHQPHSAPLKRRMAPQHTSPPRRCAVPRHQEGAAQHQPKAGRFAGGTCPIRHLKSLHWQRKIGGGAGTPRGYCGSPACWGLRPTPRSATTPIE